MGSVIDTPSVAAFQAITTAIGTQTTTDLSGGSLMRDLGKEIDMKINGQLAARLRLVELVENAFTYGHSGNIFYVLTYQSTNFGGVFVTDQFIACSRTGSCPQKLPNSQYFVVALQNSHGNNGYKYLKSSIPNGLLSVNVPYTQVGSVINTTTVANMKSLYLQVFDRPGQNFEINPGTLFKDLGKTVDFTVNGALAIRWNLVQLVKGATTEGVPSIHIDSYGNDTSVAYIVTFCADQLYYMEPVVCVRTGSSISNSPETQFLVNIYDISGNVFPPHGVEQGIQEALSAGVSFTQDGSRYNTDDLSSMIALFGYIKDNGENYPTGSVPQLLFRDLCKNIDFTIQGKLAIRLRLAIEETGLITEGESFPYDYLYYSIAYVSDSAVFGANLVAGRTG